MRQMLLVSLIVAGFVSGCATEASRVGGGQVPDLTLTKTHSGSFTRGQTGATYTITVSNGGTGATSGTVTVVDTLPAGLTATALSGAGWNCTLGTLTCFRNDALAAGNSYSAITLTVNVAANAPTSVTNTATVSGGGEQNINNDTANDATGINVSLRKLSTDMLTNSTSQHATEVEPDTFSFGSTIVSTFQVGRIFTGGAADIGFATSTDGGVTWTSGLLTGITIFQGGTSFNAVSDPSVAYDAAHGQWIIASIAVHEDASGNPVDEQVLVSRSPDGVNWGSPIAVNPVAVYDKDWIVCDDTPSSPFYGHCYVQWRDSRGLMTTSTSTDGGLTWQSPLHTADMVNGFGGQPVVQPNGTVISPMNKLLVTDMLSFTSTDGGASWTASTEISPITDHAVAGNLRSGQVSSAEIDAAGKVYVVWADCRFRTNCSSNDIVLSTSTDGVNWTPPARIPIDPVTSSVDHFIPGLAVDRATSGSAAHLTLTYYYYPVSNCGTVCDLFVGFVSSQDGGQTWSAPVPLAGPMKTDWLAKTGGGVTPGAFVGDYISGSYVNGKAFAVFAVAAANSGSVLDEAMYTTTQPMMPSASSLRFSSEGEMPVPNATSDHEPREIYPVRKRPPF